MITETTERKGNTMKNIQAAVEKGEVQIIFDDKKLDELTKQHEVNLQILSSLEKLYSVAQELDERIEAIEHVHANGHTSSSVPDLEVRLEAIEDAIGSEYDLFGED